MSADITPTPGCSEPLEEPEHHHPLLRHLTDWTRQVGEQPASRVAPGIAAASREFHAKLKALPTSTTLSESKAIVAPGAKIAMRLKQQRDECAEALRGLVAVVEKNFPMPAGVHPGSPLDKARKALADVPTYEQQLRNIFEGIADAE